MTLIKSISGIRGTIGGKVGQNLTPTDIVKFTAAYRQWLKESLNKSKLKVVVGRDGRISGSLVQQFVIGTLSSMGIDVVSIGMASTPTTELAVTGENADGGIIITASHNPKNWNALKLLNNKGEFISAEDGQNLLNIAEAGSYEFAETDNLGQVYKKEYNNYHIDNVLNLELVDALLIQKANLKVAVDGINSVGGVIVPQLLNALGVEQVFKLNCEPTGNFAHVAEPLPEHLSDIAELTVREGADLAFVVDPDVDRLVIVNEDGSMFGEEYTLTAIADYVLENTPGNTVSNMSSSRSLRIVTEKHGGKYEASAVGEVHVVEKMRETDAVIGGEGNGGIIYPESHYGRDALVGIGLFLTHYAKKKLKCSELRATYPNYYISKNKIELTPEIDVDAILQTIFEKYKDTAENISTIDGVKIEFENNWVHLRKSNTEPIIRIYSEDESLEAASSLAEKFVNEIKCMTH